MKHPAPGSSHLRSLYQIEDSLGYLRVAAFLDLLLLFLLLAPDSPSFDFGKREGLLLLSAAALLIFARSGGWRRHTSLILFVVVYTGCAFLDAHNWYGGIQFEIHRGYSKGFLLSGLIAVIPFLYLALRLASVLCLLPLVVAVRRRSTD